jgi:hypothetical protein
MQINAWQLRFDPEDRGLRDGWADPAAWVDQTDWHPITVPSAWNEVFGDDTPDIAWYRARVPWTAAPGGRQWLRLGAVCTEVRAWCDGRPIGEHAGNWEPVVFELPADGTPNAVREVVLRVDRARPPAPSRVGDRVIEHGHITKGFHDILSRQPAGLWQPAELLATGPHALDPLGVTVLADLETGEVEVDVRCDSAGEPCTARMVVQDSSGGVVAEDAVPLDAAGTRARLVVDRPEPWSPESPTLYTLACALIDADGGVSDQRRVRFGFRKVETRGRRVLLNGRPLHLSAMLDWGHEPMQTAPAPSRAELRRRFTALRAMGINCVCVCLWYPPQHYYDIADETGMLLWQEHPVWKPAMDDGNREAFKRHFERFFRMDLNHPSVVIVSGSCEHDAMDLQLAAWWWQRARELMPDRLLQVQTAFLRLVPPEQTDLYDEHTYENSGRWPEFLADMDATLAPLPDKPFVMGESVLYNDWPDVPGLLAAVGDDRPWWVSRVLDHAAQVEAQIAGRYGTPTLERFRRDARAWHLQGRKWQTEVFRHNPDHAGLVQNGLRDVAQCPLGFMDDLDQWKLTPEQARPWLAPNALLLRTPGYMRGFHAGTTARLEIGAASFDASPVDPHLHLSIDAAAIGWQQQHNLTVQTAVGEVGWSTLDIELPGVDRPTALDLTARAEGAPTNRWRLWVVPARDALPDRVAVLHEEREMPALAFEEVRYSSGWGLEVGSWAMAVPDAAALLPGAPRVDAGGLPDAGMVVSHALTPELLGWVERGGRLLHLPDRGVASVPTMIPTLWGQSPLILDRGPLAGVDPGFVLDTLDRDLHHRWVRTVPTMQVGLHDAVSPYVRLIHTHDSVGRINIADDVFAVRLGRGVVLVSALDHTTVAGAWLLGRMLAWLADEPQGVEHGIERGRLSALLVAGDAPAVTPA